MSIQNQVNKIVSKVLAAPSMVQAKPVPFAVRTVNGPVTIKNTAEYFKVVSEDPVLSTKVFAGAGFKHMDVKRFNSLTLRHVFIATIIGVVGAAAYKIHNNALLREYRADFPKFEYLHARANEAVAKQKAAELAAIFAAEDAAEAEAEAQVDVE